MFKCLMPSMMHIPFRSSDSHAANGGLCLPNEILIRILQEIPPLELPLCRRVGVTTIFELKWR